MYLQSLRLVPHYFLRHYSVLKPQCLNISRWNQYLKPSKQSRDIFTCAAKVSRGFKGETAILQRLLINQIRLNTACLRQLHSSSTQLSNGNGNGDKKKKNNNNKDEEDDKISTLLTKAFLWMLTAYMFIAFISLMFPGTNQPEVVRYLSWNEFVHQMLAKGEVEEIRVKTDVNIATIVLQDGAIIKGRKAEYKTYHMNIVDIQRFDEKLRDAEMRLGIRPENGVPVIYERSSDSAARLLTSLLIGAVIVAILFRNKNIRSSINIDLFSQMTRAKFTLIDPIAGEGRGVKFSDVAGLKEAKVEIAEFVDYLKRPEHYNRLGAKVPRGALLLGPPGCGKTMLAKAVSTEANVPFLSMNGSEFIEMIGGLGAARVRDLFKEAKKRAPCIIYIDEIDAIGRQRSEGGGRFSNTTGEGEQTLNQLLVELDGMASKQGVLMLASTNRADVLDKALLRPGRFDRHILIDLPTLHERKEIFEHHLKPIVLEYGGTSYSSRMAALTPGFSGADIANVCNEAALHAARTGAKVVKGQDLEYAVERVVGGTEKRSQVISPVEKKIVAYHESGHALVGWLLEHTDALLKVTIVPRTNQALGFAQYLPTDRKLYSQEQLFDRMCMALGGRVAESLTFNRVTTGAQNDLQKVTKMAYAQIRQYGMSPVVGLVSFPEDDESSEWGKKPYSKKLAAILDLEVRKMVASAYLKTEKVLKDNSAKLQLLAEELLAKEVLNYQDVERLIGPPPFGKKNMVGPEEFEISVMDQAGITTTPPSNEQSSQGDQPRTDDKDSVNAKG